MATAREVATVDILISNNATWADVFQFGCVAVNDECCLADVDTSWNFNNKTFLLDIKAAATDATPLLAMSSTNGMLVVTDAFSRILAMNVTDAVIRTDLPPATYVYDLIMVDNTDASRVRLMKGTLVVEQGVTIED